MEAPLDTSQMPSGYLQSLDQVKRLHSYAQAHKGKPRDPKDVQTVLMRQHSGIEFNKQQRQQTMSGNTMLAVVVGEPYPPSTKPLNDLTTITISQLLTETHHYGKVLLVRRVGELIFGRATIGAVVVDQLGDAEFLKLAHGDASLGDEGLLPCNAVLAIKEPYYTFTPQKETELRVDHPLDIICLSPSDSRVPAGLVLEGEGRLVEIKSPLEWKNAGNSALKQKEYFKASDCYKQGLAAVTSDETPIQHDLYRNRAQAHLHLGRYDAAKADAFAALTRFSDKKSMKVDAKAYYRAGCADYHLRDFEIAKSFFECQLQLAPDDKDGKLMMTKLQIRLREQALGDYDFGAIIGKLSKTSPRVDAANFTTKAAIKTSLGRGRGLFAAVDIKPGELVLCEKAFCVLFEHEEQHFRAVKYNTRSGEITQGSSALWKELVSSIHRNPSSADAILALSGEYQGLGTAAVTVDGDPAMDTFQIHDIVVRNAYGCPTPSKQQAKTDFGFHERVSDQMNSGIWTHASYINHACVCNARRTFIGDFVIFRASKPIAKDEEITTAYTEIPDYDERQKNFADHWRFRCACLLCKAEGADSPADRKARKKLEQAAVAFREHHQLRDGAAPPSAGLVAKAEGYAQSIRASYDAGRYRGVPRNAALGIQAWLVQAYSDRHETGKCLAAVAGYFKLLAYEDVVVTEKTVTLRPGDGSNLTREGVESLVYAVNAMMGAGKRQAAAKLEVAAKELYLIGNGVMDGYVGIPEAMLR